MQIIALSFYFVITFLLSCVLCYVNVGGIDWIIWNWIVKVKKKKKFKKFSVSYFVTDVMIWSICELQKYV